MGQNRRDFLGLGAALLAMASLAKNAKAEEKNHCETSSKKRQLTRVEDPKRVDRKSVV